MQPRFYPTQADAIWTAAALTCRVGSDSLPDLWDQCRHADGTFEWAEALGRDDLDLNLARALTNTVAPDAPQIDDVQGVIVSRRWSRQFGADVFRARAYHSRRVFREAWKRVERRMTRTRAANQAATA
jgi:hypothetical protein